MAETLEIIGIYLGERYRFQNDDGDVIIGSVYVNSDVNGEVSIKGQADDGELQIDQVYRFLGKWTTYRNKRKNTTEDQFHFTSFVKQQPVSREGIVAYLRQAGEGHGFGAIRANKMWELFGQDAVRIMREDPERAADELNRVKLPITYESTRQISANLQAEVATEASLLDLTDLFNGRGFPKGTPKSCIRLWGAPASNIVRRNPYLLMKRVRGAGFKKCDKLYLDLGHHPGRLKRQALCAWYSVAGEQEGHTWYPNSFVERCLRESISAADVQEERAIELAIRAKYLAEQRTETAVGPLVTDGSIRWLAERVEADHERALAKHIAAAMRENAKWPDVDQIEGVSEHQRNELRKAFRGGSIACLTGIAGSGKTYCAGKVIKEIARRFGTSEIIAGTPTGRASIQLTEALYASGLDIRARTWHSLFGMLEYQEKSHFNCKLLLADEQSMQEVSMCAGVMRRRSPGTLILFLGDIQQLLPVGRGAPFRDMMGAGVPFGELIEAKRQDGSIANMILNACGRIRLGEDYEVLRSLDDVDIESGRNLVRLSANTPEKQISQLLRAIAWIRSKGFDPIWDVTTITPTNGRKKGQEFTGSAVSRKRLNRLLQGELNPNNPPISGSIFRIGDKAVNTCNGNFKAVEYDENDPDIEVTERGEVYVANGDVGRVIKIEDKMMVVDLSAPKRTIIVPRGKLDEKEEEDKDGNNEESEKSTGTGCSFDLAFASSAFKAQGAGYQICITILDEYAGARRLSTREHLYTCVSRGIKLDIEIGKDETVRRMLKNQAVHKRKTFLKELIRQEQAALSMGEF